MLEDEAEVCMYKLAGRDCYLKMKTHLCLQMYRVHLYQLQQVPTLQPAKGNIAKLCRRLLEVARNKSVMLNICCELV